MKKVIGSTVGVLDLFAHCLYCSSFSQLLLTVQVLVAIILLPLGVVSLYNDDPLTGWVGPGFLLVAALILVELINWQKHYRHYRRRLYKFKRRAPLRCYKLMIRIYKWRPVHRLETKLRSVSWDLFWSRIRIRFFIPHHELG